MNSCYFVTGVVLFMYSVIFIPVKDLKVLLNELRLANPQVQASASMVLLLTKRD